MKRRHTAEEVLALPCPTMPETGVLQSIMVIYQWYNPGADDPDERGPFLGFHRDNEQPAWVQLGMLTSATDDLRRQLGTMETDED